MDIRTFKTKSKEYLTEDYLSKDDIIDLFYDLKEEAGKHYDNALLDRSFERDNENTLTVLEDVLYDLPDDYVYKLKEDKNR